MFSRPTTPRRIVGSYSIRSAHYFSSKSFLDRPLPKPASERLALNFNLPATAARKGGA